MHHWQSTPPPDCPFEPSPLLTGIAFTGHYANYTFADTWYPSWASDDILYSPWTDGDFNRSPDSLLDVHTMECSSDSRVRSNAERGEGAISRTGQARILGDDPLNLTVENLGMEYASPAPYEGRYPCGSLVYNGVWYYGTYCLDETDRGLNWDILAPFVGFRVSYDFGKTWQPCPHTPAASIFGENAKNGGKVKIGAPHFVDFGKNLEHSPDGKAYMVGHGATDLDANLAWISGDQAYLIRVMPSPETMNDPSAWEFFAGHNAQGQPVWTYDFSQIKPLIEWKNRVGHATMTWFAPLKKYLLCCTDGWPTVSTMNTYILESDSITGPWRLVTFMEKFGEQAYFVNFPSKFISADGSTAWLCYSANFTSQPGIPPEMVWRNQIAINPPGSAYALTLQEVKLLRS